MEKKSALNKKRIVILGSGTGSNAARIMDYFKDNAKVEVSLVISNNVNASILGKAVEREVPIMILDRKEFFSDDSIIKFLQSENIDLIVLAGFLWMVPQKLVQAFTGKIINIHPALLPKHGGKGMFGMNVHQSVITAGDKQSGITIHHVNEFFDEGKIIYQERCEIEKNDTAETLANKVQKLEHEHYPKIIEQVLFSKI